MKALEHERGHADDEPDDHALMARVAKGDQRAFSVLVSRHLGRTVRMAARILGNGAEAEDVAQEAFTRVWKQAPKWRPKGHSDGAALTTWLHRVVVNLCIDRQRRKTPHPVGENLPEQEDTTPRADKQMESGETAQEVRIAVAELPDKQRIALTLCFFEGLSNAEAADAMDIGIKAVESLLVRARKNLRDRLHHYRETGT